MVPKVRKFSEKKKRQIHIESTHHRNKPGRTLDVKEMSNKNNDSVALYSKGFLKNPVPIHINN